MSKNLLENQNQQILESDHYQMRLDVDHWNNTDQIKNVEEVPSKIISNQNFNHYKKLPQLKLIKPFNIYEQRSTNHSNLQISKINTYSYNQKLPKIQNQNEIENTPSYKKKKQSQSLEASKKIKITQKKNKKIHSEKNNKKKRQRFNERLLNIMAQLPRNPVQRSEQQSIDFANELMKEHFFSQIGFNTMMNIIRNFRIECFKNNQYIYHKNTSVKYFYIIIFGRVKLFDQNKKNLKYSEVGQTLLEQLVFKSQGELEYPFQNAKAVSIVGLFKIPIKSYNKFREKMIESNLKYQIYLLQSLLRRNMLLKRSIRNHSQFIFQ